jgi:hypothetical protein
MCSNVNAGGRQPAGAGGPVRWRRVPRTGRFRCTVAVRPHIRFVTIGVEGQLSEIVPSFRQRMQIKWR